MDASKDCSVAQSPTDLPKRMRPYALGAAGIAATLVALAVVNARLAREAEKKNPPTGRFVGVGGVRLHYIDEGKGEPLVLLHGNGSMAQDFTSSGLVALAAKTFRVIAFDRPGFGHSERPRGESWNAAAQGALFAAALDKIGVSHAVVFGHSWGASAAVALASQRPDLVQRLVLASGYYYPGPRLDALLASLPAIPLIGDVVRYSLSPILSRLLWPLLVRKTFSPDRVPPKFHLFPKEMAFRPSQIRAAAAESGMMLRDAYAARKIYKHLKMPTTIIAGEQDEVVDIETQSARLHRELPHSLLCRLSGAGHMVHQTETDKVMWAISEGASAGGHRSGSPVPA